MEAAGDHEEGRATTHWSTIAVRSGARRLSGAARLAMLLRWQRGDVLLGVVFLDAADDDREIATPFAVDWSRFPTHDALDALSAAKRKP
jgi:hypothetical protein